jgi:hypothetical protein
MQNFVFLMGLSVANIQLEAATLQQILLHYVYLRSRTVVWHNIQIEHQEGTWAVILGKNTAFLDDSHSGLPRHMLYSNSARTVPFDPDHGIAASDLLFLQPAKHHFPMPYAQIYSTGFSLWQQQEAWPLPGATYLACCY